MLELFKGDADTLTETITGLSSLSGYSAKIYFYLNGTLVDTFTGTINSLTITYDIKNEDTKTYTCGLYDYETKIWDSSDHVYTPSKGKIRIKQPLVTDPS